MATVSTHIHGYLRHHQVPVAWLQHPRAVDAPLLAQVLHVSGHRLGKTVVVQADGRYWLALLPAHALLDEERLALALGAHRVRLAEEWELHRLFPDCEVGSEPPFGGLYQLPVVMDVRLSRAPTLVFRGGSHEDAVSMRREDFLRLERPVVADITWQPPARLAPPARARRPGPPGPGHDRH